MSDGEDGEDRVFRPNMVYRSLRRQGSRTICQLKKKLETIEDTVRMRRALRPLQNEETPIKGMTTPSPSTRSQTGYSAHKELEGYEFDERSNLLRTPKMTPTPRVLKTDRGLKKIGSKVAILRRKSKVPVEDSPRGTRIAKQLARCKLEKMNSPRGMIKSNSFIQRLNNVRRMKKTSEKSDKSSLLEE